MRRKVAFVVGIKNTEQLANHRRIKAGERLVKRTDLAIGEL